MARKFLARRSTRTISKRTAFRSFARKRRTWLTAFNTPCFSLLLGPPGPCVEGQGSNDVFQQVLMQQALLQNQYEDDATVVRILGKLHFRFLIPQTVTSLADALFWIQSSSIIWRMALQRGTVIADIPGFPTTPGGIPYAPLDSIQFSESKWLHVWEHTHVPELTGQVVFRPAGSVIGCCSNVTGSGGGGGADAIDNGITWGVSEGAIDTEIDPITISTNCEPCFTPDELFSETNFSSRLMPWTVSIDFKKRIRLKENECLVLHHQWQRLGVGGGDAPDQPFIEMLGGLRLLIES